MPRGTRWGVAVPTEIDGIRFASKREAAVFAELKLRERIGEISGLECQPLFPIEIDGRPVLTLGTESRRGRQMTYRADFAFVEQGKRRVIEVKGMDDTASRLRRALVQHIHGIEIEVMK